MKKASALLGILITILIGSQAQAWGGRGHHTICDVATFLVQNKELKLFLSSKPQTMGHLCNIPDIYWRSLAPEMTKEGNPTHFLDSEVVPVAIQNIPLDYKQVITDFEGKKRGDGEGVIRSIPHELGSIWWRADQFYRRAVAEKEGLATANAEGFALTSKEEQNENNPYNKAVFNFYVNLGLMGHFVGDCSQPLHITNDYDGYGKGHGGVHVFYEDGVVNSTDGDLHHKVLIAARKILSSKKKKSFLSEGTVIEKMKALSLISYTDIGDLLKADLITKPSEQKEEHGMKIRKSAERNLTEKSTERFEPMIVKQMARSAALLATLWDEAYVQAGSPKLSFYRSYKYPLTPDFVMPDYYEIKKDDAKK